MSQQEREEFVSWLSGTYPHAWPRHKAENAWDQGHISRLAWVAGRAALAQQAAANSAGHTAAVRQALEALEEQHRERRQYSIAKQRANATCRQFKDNPLSALVESGYMHGMGKRTEAAIEALRAALAAQQAEREPNLVQFHKDMVSAGYSAPKLIRPGVWSNDRHRFRYEGWLAAHGIVKEGNSNG